MEDIKRNRIHDILVNRIRSGSYVYGDSFLGVKDLMTEFSTSYVTSCRILRSLADEGYLLCRSRSKGYTVCYMDEKHVPRTKKINFITECTRDVFEQRLFLEGKALFEKHNWKVCLHEVGYPTKIETLQEILNEPDTYSIIAGIDVPWQRFIATLKHLENRILIIGRISHNDSISTVICDESASVQRILQHFNACGRTRPALIVSDSKSELENMRVAAWRKSLTQYGLDFHWVEEHIWAYNKSQYNDIRCFFQDILSKYGKEIDAIVLPTSFEKFAETAQELRFRRQNILQVAIGGNLSPELYDIYEIDNLDNNPSGHLELALEIMEYRYNSGKRECGFWFFCPPGEIIRANLKT